MWAFRGYPAKPLSYIEGSGPERLHVALYFCPGVSGLDIAGHFAIRWEPLDADAGSALILEGGEARGRKAPIAHSSAH